MEGTNLILSDQQVKQKVKRIAYEMYENNFRENEIVLAGILDQGYKLAQLIAANLKAIASFDVRIIEVRLEKFTKIQTDVNIDCKTDELKDKVVILVDDVMNTGRTFAYCMKPFLEVKVKKIETAVLVNRSHTKFPISVKYTGYELATSLNEHVEVQLDEGLQEVYLK